MPTSVSLTMCCWLSNIWNSAVKRDNAMLLQRLLSIPIPLRRIARLQTSLSLDSYSHAMAQTRKNNPIGKRQKRSKSSGTRPVEGSNEQVLLADVQKVLGSHSSNQDDQEKVSGDGYVSPERFSEIEVEILELSSTGDGLGLSPNSDHVYVVPFTAPGDVVRAKVVNHFVVENYTLTDFINVIKPSRLRDDSRIGCRYFAKCSGCQLQMLSYKDQLAHKKTIIERAYKNFSALVPELIPEIGDTIGSPLQYSYRTKLTPHFDRPPGIMSRAARRLGSGEHGFVEVPPIGFMQKGRRRTIDIEECPIGTKVVNLGMKRERKKVAAELTKYKRGATVLLRESTTRRPMDPETARTGGTSERDPDYIGSDADEKDEGGFYKHTLLAVNFTQATITSSHPKYYETKSCISDQNATSIEYIDDYVFTNKAGAFFQNNNSILPRFTAYIRHNILHPNSSTSKPEIKHLIDAYCGSGLFTVTLSSLFTSSIGIDIAGASVLSARANATENNIANATFITADAAALFKEVDFDSDSTAVVIDPPRKGCDDEFLSQLLKYGPKRIVYVSCNVHTQARDVGVMVQGKGGHRYELESLRGFDFFPQTGHVESVAILNRVEETEMVRAEEAPINIEIKHSKQEESLPGSASSYTKSS